MGQITTGLRAVLSNPAVYSAFQNLMGAHKSRAKFVSNDVRPVSGCAILDIGCGPAEILAYLPEVDYWGFDISQEYVDSASKRFGQRGHFRCQHLTMADIEALPPFDIVMALGVLHHMDDLAATELFRLGARALKPGGRLLTLDPCLEDGQNPLARILVKNDRGQNVRTRSGYAALAQAVFEAPRVEVRHQRWIPYTHCFIECIRK